MAAESLSDTELDAVVEAALQPFYAGRIDKLESLRLGDVLGKKNVYMFRALGVNTFPSLVSALLTAFVSSSDETRFGNAFFEPVVKRVSRGNPTGTRGMDINIETEDEHIELTVKSGTSWGNSDQWASLRTHFANARRSYRTHASRKRFVAVVGQCYGRRNSEPTEDRPFHIMSGQRFWTYLTGDPTFYLRLMASVGRVSDAHRGDYDIAYTHAINRLTTELVERFATTDGTIDWDAVLRFNSGA